MKLMLTYYMNEIIHLGAKDQIADTQHRFYQFNFVILNHPVWTKSNTSKYTGYCFYGFIIMYVLCITYKLKLLHYFKQFHLITVSSDRRAGVYKIGFNQVILLWIRLQLMIGSVINLYVNKLKENVRQKGTIPIFFCISQRHLWMCLKPKDILYKWCKAEKGGTVSRLRSWNQRLFCIWPNERLNRKYNCFQSTNQ